MIETIVIALIVLVGVMTQTVLGFGSALFIVPVMLAFFSAPVSVTVALLVGSVVCALVLFGEWKKTQVRWPVVLWLFVTAVPGLLLGAYLVSHTDKAILQIIIGLLIIASIVVQEYVFPKPTRKFGITKGIRVTGFLSGLGNAAAAMAGPPLVIWMRSHKIKPDVLRHNISAVALLMNLASLVLIQAFSTTGFERQGFMVFVQLIPAVIAGYFVGRSLTTELTAASTKIYHKVVFVGVVVAGLACAGTGLINL